MSVKRYQILGAVSALIVSLCLLTTASAQAPSFVQVVADKTGGAANTFSLSFSQNTVAGDLILVGLDYDTNSTPASVTDTQNNVFTPVGSQLTSGSGHRRSRVYYAKNIKGGADTVTVNLSANSGWLEIYLTEYSGVDQTNPIDAQAGASGTAGTVSSGNATTTVAGDVIFGFCIGDWACTAGSGFTTRSNFNANLVEDKLAGNPGAYAATGSATNGWTMQMVALKPAPIASGSLSISPHTATLTSTRSQQFSANATGVNWLVDGVVGGSATSGTISNSGLYVPPSSVGVHTVTVITGDQSQSANATVYITNYAGKFTHQNDNARSGQNLSEIVLTPSNVNQAQFGKLFSYPLDGQAFASPLYVANLNIPGQGSHNVVYVATEHDSVYAFDADGLVSTPLWKVSFINPPGITTVSMIDNPNICCDIYPEVGITSTPVIDQTTGTLYVVARTAEVSGNTTNYVTRLHALDITSGAEKFFGPVVIQATVPGLGGLVPYADLTQNQRAGLLLNGGVVYIASGSYSDQFPYHGWILGYDATTLQQVMVFCTTPNSPLGGGIWQSGGGPAADSDGNIYFITGNGTFNADTGGTEWSDTFIKLSPGGVVLDYFTPHDQGNMDLHNLDLGSAGVLLLPDQPDTPLLLVGSAGKSQNIYLINRSNMGHYNPNNDNQIVQELVNTFPNGMPEPGNFSVPVYFNGNLYFSPINDTVQVFRLTNGLMSSSPTSHSSTIYSYPGGEMAISANGNANGILWALQYNGTLPGVLHAYDPANLANELYNSGQFGSRDTMDLAVKFSIPAVANGRVFVGGNSSLVIYGLLP